MKPASLLVAVLIGSVAVAASGCARRVQARAVIEPPRLNVPPPPPRVVETVVVEAPQPEPEPQEPPAPAPVEQPAAPPRPPRAGASRAAEPPKAETPPAEPVGPKPEEAKPPAPPPLQAIPAQQEIKVEAEVRNLLRRASSDLNRVDYRALGAAARTQYEQAKGFMTQSEEALRVKQLVFARVLAD